MNDPWLGLGRRMEMSTTCHVYGRRLRSSTVRPVGSSDSARALPATRSTDTSSVKAVIQGRRPRSSELSVPIDKKIVGKTTTSSSEDEGRSVNTKRQTNPVKVSKCSGVGSHARVLDIEDTPPSHSIYSFSEEDAASIRSSLLRWYDEHHRILPWRQNSYSRHEHHPTDNSQEELRVDEAKEEGSTKQATADPSSFVELDNSARGKANGKKGITNKPERAISKDGQSSQLEKTKDFRIHPVTDEQRAYEVWVSEMMLQQTQVATVIEYYRRWMEAWPTVHHLAQASQEEVNTVWAGLGYYRRARFLLEGAKQIVEKCSGFPRSLKELQEVPGIGSYTAGAIASIAFQQPVPLVDGNVVRVLSRLRAIPDSPKQTKTVKIFWALAEELVDAKRPGDLNQSIMELGATVCTPTSPSCFSCPVSSHCKALSLESRSLKLVTDFPIKVAKVPRREEYVAVCVLVVMNRAVSEDDFETNVSYMDSHILLVQRPKQGLLAGLWEFPLVSLGGVAVSAEEQTAAMDGYLKDSLGFNLARKGNFSIQKREALGTYIHLFSHIKMHMSVEWLLLCPSEGSQWQHKLTESKEATVSLKWVQADCVGKLGLTTSVKKIHSMYLNRMKLRRQAETPKPKRFKPLR